MTSRTSQWRRKRKMIIESLLSDEDSSTLIETGGETSHFQNTDETYLSVSNELDISNNQNFSSTESCYQSCLDELLVILRRNGCVLPKDARTLLKTPTSVETKTMFGGSYVYLGIEAGLRRILVEEIPEDSIIELSVNIDGVPLYKSASTQLWPILCQYENLYPFVVAIYCGNTKPKDCNLYLRDFLDEYCNLKHNGFFYNDKVHKISIKAFVCDAPARHFLKNIRSHNSYHGCERCTVKGVWEGRVVFDGEFCELRSEEKVQCDRL